MASWDLFREMETMNRDLESLWRGLSRDRSLESSFAAALGGRSYPRINLREDNDQIYLEALLPGIDAKALELTVLKNTFNIAGDRRNADDNVTWHRRERGTGRFLRTIDLPAEVDADSVQADYRNGVLNVILPKAAAAKPRRVEIQAG